MYAILRIKSVIRQHVNKCKTLFLSVTLRSLVNPEQNAVGPQIRTKMRRISTAEKLGTQLLSKCY